MPTLATISFNGLSHADGTTAVTRTLSRESSLSDGVVLRETGTTAANLADASVVRFRTKTAPNKDSVSRLTVSFARPYVANAATGLRKTANFNIEVVLPADCPANVRKDLKSCLAGYVAGTNITNWIIDRDNPI